MIPPRTALVAGGSGLVGRHCLDMLAATPSYARVIALLRRPLGAASPRVEQRPIDFTDLDALEPVAVDDAFCALGTTLAAAGSKEAFRRVDFAHVTAFARWAKRSGARRLVLVSSVGADAASSNFYLRVKGEAEESVAAMSFHAVHVLRPSLLIGMRDERRPAEALAQRVAPLLGAFLVGPLGRYRPIAASDVGAAMVGAALSARHGTCILHHRELIDLARQVTDRV